MSRVQRIRPKCFPYCKSTTKVFVAIGLSSFLLWEMYLCFLKFEREPTYTESSIVDQEETEFPAITFCSLQFPYKESKLQKHGIDGQKNYISATDSTDLRWVSTDSSVTPQGLYEEVTQNRQLLLQKVNIGLMSKNNAGKQMLKLNLSDTTNLSEIRDRYYGRCYTVHPSKSIRNYGVFVMHFTLIQNLKMFLHMPNQYHYTSNSVSYSIDTSKKTVYQIGFNNHQQLERTKANGRMSCKIHNYDKCFEDLQYLRMVEVSMDNCTAPWANDNSNICTKAKDVNATVWVSQDMLQSIRQYCPSPCYTMQVSASGDNVVQAKAGKPQLILYFQTRIQMGDENYLYPALSLFAEVGGFMGLILGYSILNMAEFVVSTFDKYML